MMSDPACTSVKCEFRHSYPTKAGDEIFYDDGSTLDSDIESTNHHMNEAEMKLGKWDYLNTI